MIKRKLQIFFFTSLCDCILRPHDQSLPLKTINLETDFYIHFLLFCLIKQLCNNSNKSFDQFDVWRQRGNSISFGWSIGNGAAGNRIIQQTMKNLNMISIDINWLGDGIYILKLTAGDRINQVQIMKID